ncbi:MAG: hypothetical protein OQK35_00870 [Alphaproteobacteria bacterium]|nr:hypothetical protein [Rhodospirillales bacterium]MCW9044861.1 hypothetical protein [Alphaproteobacteria bacterium]
MDVHNPTPDERAEVIIKQLEMFIREGRSEKGGMNFRKWQEMARVEIVHAILEDEKDWRENDNFVTKVLAMAASGVITVGMWGTVLAFSNSPNKTLEGIAFFAGGMLLMGSLSSYFVWKAFRRYKANRREGRLANIKSLDWKLKKLDKLLADRVKDMEDSAKEMVKQKEKREEGTELRNKLTAQVSTLRKQLETAAK